ncbi:MULTISPECIES: hypothetical protein [unclassified Endozoicomonas]|uniref:hypothetical protein n=1 Tax=unclassified Endozoicomonas TaxID=2644528 RepID=UPI003BB6EC73
MINKETRSDRIKAVPAAKFIYCHTFVNYKAAEIDPDWLYGDLLTSVRLKVCRDADINRVMDAGGTFAFSYFGREGLMIGGFEINKQDCENKSAVKIERTIQLS